MEDKRAKILDVAVEEFASHGYKAASTNRICEVAGVSKGLIFHYFGSKEKLYTAAVTYSVDLAMEEVSMDDMPKGNFVEGAIWSTKQKLAFSHRHPAVFKLMMQSFANPPEALAERMTAYFNEMMAVQTVFVNQMLDGLTLREDVAREDASDVIQSLFEYITRLVTVYLQKNPDATMEDMQPLIDKFMQMIVIAERGMVEQKQT
ncbi:TetR/AcrR family transcriptional regulator [Listeria booriae]|uniref:TetR/AcrR family transcriptional regulator n=1 Tax=Listeria booriae TaxID=1552123 RepID=UPI0016296B1E|nr:TetR/AcrR family transcriptional regulator [Listeria booriae]MBC1984729.1 TetR/AcrR family transcriptional regulator [Listeria booriae]MBC2078093.1 TetR/AcrR family transcriptional regulator [Listeria booriae]